MTSLDLVLERLSGVRAVGRWKWTALCPAHDDRSPSLSLTRGTDGRVLLTCHAGCSFERICSSLGLTPRDLFESSASRRGRAHRDPIETFAAEEARTVWTLALHRARDDSFISSDVAVYDYVRCRGLEQSWETGPFGVLAEGMCLPHAVAHWPRHGHNLVAPLHDAHGSVVNIQSRCITGGSPKTLLPKGSAARGSLFATRSGRELLRDSSFGGGKVILGEGLTDFLALSIAAPVPVLSVPGASFFAAAIGPWVAGRDVYLAADNDEAGEAAIPPTARAALERGARNVFAITWPEGCKDACDAIAALGAIGLSEFLECELLAEGGADASE